MASEGQEEPLAMHRYTSARKRMVESQLASRGIRDPATLAAMGIVPREAFVAPEHQALAYLDRALSIGRGQTISQPYMVARMTQALGLADLDWPWSTNAPKLLDVGTGSGYQAAVLAQLGARVTTIERDDSLAEEARERLRALGYAVNVVTGDGSVGYPPNAPYSGVVVGAGAPSIPPPLIEQLQEGGRLVIPVGSRSAQQLTVVRRRGGGLDTRTTDSCVFVPLTGVYGYPD